MCAGLTEVDRGAALHARCDASAQRRDDASIARVLERLSMIKRTRCQPSPF
ncbi:hypothetical protein Ae168Ps1_4868c [Pseudonocardia sp. Ae168_Ps1]|nr:hypothetical protein Ae150APs1_4829c [Pseudonocardia sp. Ae150A_Ps1]OLL82462.1 hypothetical protein Ae168Ps1_4868c [Pseudonocardia sp. Ae168_Ps1]OLL90536.1 hypothetical protein Ae356Ps1_0433c [Pseudonocardia sp. Ae356_Ps1]